MAESIVMPPLSQTTSEVTLVEWLVHEGDVVARGDPLCEVETDKVTMQVESFAAGTVLRIVARPEEVIPVGEVIAYVGTPGEEIPGPPAGRTTPSPGSDAGEPARPAQSAGDSPGGDGRPTRTALPSGVKATLIVRNLAEKSGIDLGRVPGTGPGGLITRDDLAAFKATGQAGGRSGESLSENQRAVGRLVTLSKGQVPHFYLKTTVEMDGLTGYRDQPREPAGDKPSITAILTWCLGRALARHKRLNGYFSADSLVSRDRINIAVAVASGDDLYAPVITDADTKSIAEIHLELKALTDRARSGLLVSEDVRGATFTISNLGMYPVDEFSAIIGPNQSGILAVGASRKQLAVGKDGGTTVVTAAVFTGSFDHRVVAGAAAAGFMASLKTIIEEEIGK